MKTTKVYCTPGKDGTPHSPLQASAGYDRPAIIVWEADFKRYQRAMKLVRELAKHTKGYNRLLCSEYWVDKARAIAGKDGAK